MNDTRGFPTPRVNKDNFEEIRRYLLNNGTNKTRIRYGTSSKQHKFVESSQNFEEYQYKYRKQLREQARRYREQHANDTVIQRGPQSDSGNRIHFGVGTPSTPKIYNSPFTNKPVPEEPKQQPSRLGQLPSSRPIVVESSGTAYYDTVEFTAAQLRTLCEAALRGCNKDECGRELGYAAFAPVNQRLRVDPVAMGAWKRAYEAGTAKREAIRSKRLSNGVRGYYQKVPGTPSNRMQLSENERRKSLSVHARSVWDSLSEEEKRARVERMIKGRAKARANRGKAFNVSAVDIKPTKPVTESVKAEDTTPTPQPVEVTMGTDEPVKASTIEVTLNPVFNEQMDTEAKKAAMFDEDVVGWLEVKKRKGVDFRLMPGMLLSTVLALIAKACGIINLEWYICLVPVAVSVGVYLLMLLLLGASLSLAMGKFGNGIKIDVHRTNRKGKK